jgi:hypothetical protein
MTPDVPLYAVIVLRRTSALLVVLALAGSPAVTSTRMFCRYTGAEIVGCEESGAPAHPQIRGESCCLRLTLYSVDSARTLVDNGGRIAAPAVLAAVIFVPRIPVIAPPEPEERHGPVDHGPPVFLTNRALLI